MPKLDSTTVLDDGARDTLIGGRELDWLFAGADDDAVGRRPEEQVD